MARTKRENKGQAIAVNANRLFKNNTECIFYCGEVRFGVEEIKEVPLYVFDVYKNDFETALSTYGFNGKLKLEEVFNEVPENVLEENSNEMRIVNSNGDIETIKSPSVAEDNEGDLLDRYMKTKSWKDAVKEIKNIATIEMCQSFIEKANTLDISPDDIIIKELRGKLKDLELKSGTMIGK